MKIYVASSWRNMLQPSIVRVLRGLGHDVYDFRHPKPGDDGFRWSEVGGPADYKHGDRISADVYRSMLAHPRAAEGYESDIGHVRDCDAVVYVLPCGRSASFEFGYAMGQGKRGYVVAFDDTEPELMFREATIVASMEELRAAFSEPAIRALATQDPGVPVEAQDSGPGGDAPLVGGAAPLFHHAPAVEGPDAGTISAPEAIPGVGSLGEMAKALREACDETDGWIRNAEDEGCHPDMMKPNRAQVAEWRAILARWDVRGTAPERTTVSGPLSRTTRPPIAFEDEAARTPSPPGPSAAEERAAGYAEGTADVVAWLRQNHGVARDRAEWQLLIETIERGEYAK